MGGLLGGLTELARAVPYESRSLFALRITVQQLYICRPAAAVSIAAGGAWLRASVPSLLARARDPYCSSGLGGAVANLCQEVGGMPFPPRHQPRVPQKCPPPAKRTKRTPSPKKTTPKSTPQRRGGPRGVAAAAVAAAGPEPSGPAAEQLAARECGGICGIAGCSMHPTTVCSRCADAALVPSQPAESNILCCMLPRSGF